MTEVVLISSVLDKKNYRDFAFKKLDRVFEELFFYIKREYLR